MGITEPLDRIRVAWNRWRAWVDRRLPAITGRDAAQAVDGATSTVATPLTTHRGRVDRFSGVPRREGHRKPVHRDGPHDWTGFHGVSTANGAARAGDQPRAPGTGTIDDPAQFHHPATIDDPAQFHQPGSIEDPAQFHQPGTIEDPAMFDVLEADDRPEERVVRPLDRVPRRDKPLCRPPTEAPNDTLTDGVDLPEGAVRVEDRENPRAFVRSDVRVTLDHLR